MSEASATDWMYVGEQTSVADAPDALEPGDKAGSGRATPSESTRTSPESVRAALAAECGVDDVQAVAATRPATAAAVTTRRTTPPPLRVCCYPEHIGPETRAALRGR